MRGNYRKHLLSKHQHALLCEALRRYTRHHQQDGKPLTECWTGLGTATDYKPVSDAGLMQIATTPNPHFDTWWKLTPAGSKIVQFWLASGFNHLSIEAGNLPPMELEESCHSHS